MRLRHSFSSIKQFENCSYRYYLQRVTKKIVDLPGAASIYGERVHKYLEDRINEGAPLPEELNKHEAVCRKIKAWPGETVAEKELTLTEHLTPTGWFDPDAWFRSKLDILNINGPKATTLDWKTGKRRPEFMQHEFAALQIFTHNPEVEVVDAAFIWLKEDSKVDKETYERDKHYGPIKKKLLEKTERIQEALELEVWPARPSGLCAYCPAKSFCEYAR